MIKTVNDVVNGRKCYVLYDVLVEEAGPIFDAVSDEIAVRSTVLALADCAYVRDIKLVHVANIDSCTMKVELVEQREIDYHPALEQYCAQLQIKEVK